jgi:glycosyltransferase involved in cell wall biosynthesis
MRILFLHPNFPAQFRHIIQYLARSGQHQLVFMTKRKEGAIPGVHKVLYEPVREVNKDTHLYMHALESAVLEGQAVYRTLDQLKRQGFVPDVIYGHSGWGPTLFVKDIFPNTPLLCYFEWFENAHGSNLDFDPTSLLTPDQVAGCRVRNTPILIDLYSADGGLTPTQWQYQQFPQEYQNKITVRHDGVDTRFLQPRPGAKVVFPDLGIDLSEAKEVITYATRGMEPCRGFPQFMEAVALLQQRRPQCHVVVAGADRVAYGGQLPEGQSYKQRMLDKLPLDQSRLHFTGLLPYDRYLRLLQASSVHVYLTIPFVLSWSMLDAMSVGCAVVASSTAPVQEVIQDGVNGLLCDFFSPQQLADRVEEVLDNPGAMKRIRANARATMVERYDLSELLPRHIHMLESWAKRGRGDNR